jgi:NADH dehydrogenase/NADH:ubiquinone oxidoreductase subunit G
VISLVAGTPDTQETVGRLLQNQEDIGNALKPFYGRAAGDAVTAELKKHILIAADVIAAAKAGDQAKLADAQARWQQNAGDIATLLSNANARNWKRAAVLSMLQEHLRLTTEEAVARLHGDWAADVAAYDRVHAHALTMADTLSAGLVKQFPRRFR